MAEYLLELHDIMGEGFGLEVIDSLQGETVMTAACLSGHKDTVQLLLNYGSSVQCSNAASVPPLLCAVKAGHWEIVDLVLSAGAHIEQTDKHGRTALMIAASAGHIGVVEMLLANGE